MKKYIIIISILSASCAVAQDTFDGAADTPLATHNSNYEDPRNGAYDVANALLDGSGNIRSDSESDGGWAYRNGQAMDGQTSELRVLAYGAGDDHDEPHTRILVATQSPSGSSYYGWEPSGDDGTEYTTITWYEGAPTISGMINIDISSHDFLLQQPHTFKSVLTYVSSTELRVDAYIDDILIDTLYVEDGLGAVDNHTAENVLDAGVAFYASSTSDRFPGMLWYNLGSSDTRALYDWWDDGVSFGPYGSPGPSLTITGTLTIGGSTEWLLIFLLLLGAGAILRTE